MQSEDARVRSRANRVRAPAIALAVVAGACAPSTLPPRAAAPSATVHGSVAPSASALLDTRFEIAAPSPEAVPASLHAAPGGRALFAVSQVAGERIAWVRRIDAASGAQGPLLAFADERVVATLDAPDGVTVVTSDGRRVCVAAFRATSDRADKRGCVEAAPQIVAPLGDRIALLELDVAAPAPKRRARVEVRVRWATRDGVFDADSTATGLRFERPLEGMALVDAAPRAGELDVLFYETSTRKTKSRMGSARLGVATLRADGAVDPSSRRALYDGDLEYGGIVAHRAPRLVANDRATALVVGRGACEAIRVEPTLGAIATSGCAIDPAGVASRAPSDAEAARLDAILALDPRRAPGQSRGDAPLVAWTGDRAWFFAPSGALRSVDRVGATRDEPSPFPAMRARATWSAFARDGEGISMVGERLYRLDATGATPIDLARLDAHAREAVRAPDPAGGERRRAARIGDTWWVARGDVVRVVPDPVVALAGRAHPDATALVGGATRGLFFELASGAMRVTAVRSGGEASALDESPSPVRLGFDAVERRRGGALVAGPAADDAKRVVAFVVDGDGGASEPVPTSLAVAQGEAVRLVALPAGGALLSDGARRRVAWLDDDAREIAVADWPADRAGLCVDGEPSRLAPSTAPGAFVRVADACTVGDPTWAVDGTLRWVASVARGLDVRAELAVIARPVQPPARARARAATHRRSLLASLVSFVAAPPPPCPGDMVSIAARYCVDRYEASLVDAATGALLSPDLPATPSFFDGALADWATGHRRFGNVHARAFPLPFVPSARPAAPLAVARRGARPSGYVQGVVAEAACAAAGKRLCTRDELRMACRGEDDTPFPYGATFVAGACNVFRDDHPAAILHDNASMGHLDPRLDRVSGADGPLLRATGATPACASRWGADAVYDLVGNVDEWIDDAKGAFAGGFFSRSTRAGCDALITAHPKVYLDYSTGVRCCKDAR